MFWRLAPMVFADLLFAAHVLRFYGFLPAILILAFGLTLLIKKSWLPGIWQILLLFAIGEWIRVTIEFVRYRLAMGMPYFRLIIIMGAIILFFIFVIFWWQNKKIQLYYKKGDVENNE